MDNANSKCNETQKGVLFFFQNLIDLGSVFKNFFGDHEGHLLGNVAMQKNALNLN